MKDFANKAWIGKMPTPGVGERIMEWAEKSTLGKIVVYVGSTVLLSAALYLILWFGLAIAVGLNM